MKTISAKAETVKRDWYVVDAAGKTLGRLCTELAHRLRGKHKTIYTPHVDTGDYLVVINAEKIAVTGNKMEDKNYHRFTGHIGNLKTTSLKDMGARPPRSGQSFSAFPPRRPARCRPGAARTGRR